MLAALMMSRDMMMTHTPGMALNERPKTLTAPMGVGRQCAHSGPFGI